MPTKVAEAYVSIRANTAALMADMQAAKGMTSQQAMGMGAAFPTGMAPGIQSARAQIMTIPATTAKAGAAVKAQTMGMSASFAGMAKSMGAAMGVMAAGAAFVMGGKAAVDFEQAMINATAAIPDANENMEELEKTARDWGITSGVGATKAADALGFLALAGYDSKKAIASLPIVLKFAGAGAFDAATSSDILTDALSALGMASEDPEKNLTNMTRVADLLSKASVTANTSVQQLGEAMLMKAGPAAKSAGMGVQDLTNMLMIFADQGRKGSDAGTLAAATITGLSKSAAKFKDSKLNDVVFDTEGNMRSLGDIVKGLTKEFGHLSAEERTAKLMALGVNKQAADGVNLLLHQTKAYEKYNGALNDAGGATDELANKKWKSMGAQLGVLKAQLQDFSISIMGPLVGGLISLLKPIMALVVGIGRWSQAHGDIIPKIIKITAVVLGLKVLLPLLAIGIKLVAKAMMGAMMSNPFTMVIMGLALVIQYLYDAAQAGAEWMKPVVNGAKVVQQWLGILWEKVKELGLAMWERLAPVWERIKAVVQGAIDFIVGLYTQFTDMMDSQISGTRTGWETAWEIMTALFDGYIAIITGIWNALVSVFEFTMDLINGIFQSVFGTGFGEAVNTAWGAAMGWLGQMLDILSLLTSNWSLTWELLKEVVYLRFLQVKNIVMIVVDAILVGAATLLGVYVGVWKGIYDYARHYFDLIWAVTAATFKGMIAVAKEAWLKVTGRGSGKSLAETFKKEFNESMAAADVHEVKGFKKRVAEEVNRFAGPMAANAAKRKKEREKDIVDSEARAGNIVDKMYKSREEKRRLEDKENAKVDAAEEVAEEEKKEEEIADNKEKIEAEKRAIDPEIGFKGIAEFGRAMQTGLLKSKGSEKARDDKQGRDVAGIRDVNARQLQVQEDQLKATQDQNQGLGGPN